MFVPLWKLADRCYDCASHPAPTLSPTTAKPTPVPAPTVPPVPTKTYAGAMMRNKATQCVGLSDTDCLKLVSPAGTTLVYDVDECQSLVAQDSDCGTAFQYSLQYKECKCLNKNPCCGNPSSQKNGKVDLYMMPTPSDPTCSNGLRSGDGTMCCSPTCRNSAGINICALDDAYVCNSNPGFDSCCRNIEGTLLRNCSETGFPCNM